MLFQDHSQAKTSRNETQVDTKHSDKMDKFSSQERTNISRHDKHTNAPPRKIFKLSFACAIFVLLKSKKTRRLSCAAHTSAAQMLPQR